jgi:hypothetical protein
MLLRHGADFINYLRKDGADDSRIPQELLDTFECLSSELDCLVKDRIDVNKRYHADGGSRSIAELKEQNDELLVDVRNLLKGERIQNPSAVITRLRQYSTDASEVLGNAWIDDSVGQSAFNSAVDLSRSVEGLFGMAMAYDYAARERSAGKDRAPGKA